MRRAFQEGPGTAASPRLAGMPFARASETVRVRSPFLAFPRRLPPGSPGHGVVDRRDVALSPLDEDEVDDLECPFGISGARTPGDTSKLAVKPPTGLMMRRTEAIAALL